MSIVTKKGDDGFTGFSGKIGLFGKSENDRRLRKDHPYIECLGELDELDAFLALCEIELKSNGNIRFSKIINEVRGDLFSINKQLNVEVLEQYIAELEKENTTGGFIRTWTKPGSAIINTARTICRRCERRMVTALSGMAEAEEFSGTNAKILLPWLNRLSDLLFLLAVSEEKTTA